MRGVVDEERLRGLEQGQRVRELEGEVERVKREVERLRQ